MVKVTKRGFCVGDIIINRVSFVQGIVKEVFSSWEDLKSKKDFYNLNDDKDSWLSLSLDGEFTKENLEEEWYEIILNKEISYWTCNSRIVNFYEILLLWN